MFHEIRNWNRNSINGYVEVFVDAPLDIIRQRDKSGFYEKKGVDIENVQIPSKPDIVLHNDGTQSIEKMVHEVMKITPQSEDDFARDCSYWNQYYASKSNIPSTPSNFALTVADSLIPGRHLLELGCGNGRDSLFFLNKGLYVTGVDASNEAIDLLQSVTSDSGSAMFVCDDFVKCRAVFQRQYDYIYSRFTLHSITEEQEDVLLDNIKEAMVEGSKLFIEARTIHDDIFGKGRKVDKNSYIYEGHFRRFIDPKLLKDKMQNFGYKIIRIEENRGFSTTKDSDPILLRVEACVSD